MTELISRFSCLSWLLFLYSVIIPPSSRQLSYATETFSDPVFDFAGLEVLKIETLDDEDVIYLNARAEVSEQCGTDCATYSAWTWSEETTAEIKEEQSEEEPALPGVVRDIITNFSIHGLEKRGKGKSATICGSLKLKTWSYPSPREIQSRYSEVYDFKSPLSPDEEDWFALENIKGRSTAKDHNGNKREYAVEHVLEWHLLLDFLRGAGETRQGSRCALFQNYFNVPVDIDTDIEIDTPNSIGKTSIPKKAHEAQALDWVVHQIPGIPSKSAWEYEFVVFQSDVNGVKKGLWTESQKSMTAKVQLSGGKISETTMSNNPTMEFQLENKFFDGDPATNPSQKMSYFSNNEGYLMAIKKFRDVMGVYEYHRKPLIQKYLWAQITRIGTAFEHLEVDVLPKIHKQYNYQGLKDQWEDYMSEQFQKCIAKIQDWMEKHKPAIKKLADGKRKRSLLDLVPRAKGSTPTCATSTNDQVKKRAKLLIDAYEKMPLDWENPFNAIDSDDD
ncbi:hypothetical protein P154DRAFT_564081 [Amniculicola lignicola CBS 123094]|uniref:Uncharacterized protein n=1 Tax=Amniculicola lignicola CBS 123094 TaxID=1392246 RepID=A0A6A5WEI0_9PLEO|nr:hypothetical protein P154DRAFT_564081 [Amniculicola lignicola CBS 123094]